eukprot:jgi/Botrbrau1/19599/Bobra.0035s0077.1
MPLERLPLRLAVLRRQTLHLAQNHVDTMPDKDVALLARQFLQGRPRPKALRRVGDALYRTEPAGGSIDETSTRHSERLLSGSPGSVHHADGRAHRDGRCMQLSEGDIELGEGFSDACPSVPSTSTPAERRQSSSSAPSPVYPGGLQPASSHVPSSSQHAAAGADTCPGGDARERHVTLDDSASLCGSSLEEELCYLCCEAAPTAVLLECGHGGLCPPCAYRVLLRPPHACPTCRCAIHQVAELAAPGRVGDIIRIR